MARHGASNLWVLGHFTPQLKWGDGCLAISGYHLKWPNTSVKIRDVSSFPAAVLSGEGKLGAMTGKRYCIAPLLSREHTCENNVTINLRVPVKTNGAMCTKNCTNNVAW